LPDSAFFSIRFSRFDEVAMKKTFIFALIVIAGHFAQAQGPAKIETKGEAHSFVFNMGFDAKTIEQYRLMAVDQAKGESMIKANAICEEQMHGHLFLDSRRFGPEKCLLESKGKLDADFVCEINAVNYCLL
jgi:hypothetical protein